MRFAVSIVALLFLVTPAHAQKTCTEMGCTNGLVLEADPSFDWAGGLYDIVVVADGNKMTCRGKLPLKSCEDGGERTFGCNSSNITIGESGCMLPASKHAISDIRINGTPEKVNVRISRNGKPYITRTIVPKYQTMQPNGPGCGPVCRGASHNLLTAE